MVTATGRGPYLKHICCFFSEKMDQETHTEWRFNTSRVFSCLGFDCNASIQPPSWRFFVWCFRSGTQQFAECLKRSVNHAPQWSLMTNINDFMFGELLLWNSSKHVQNASLLKRFSCFCFCMKGLPVFLWTTFFTFRPYVDAEVLLRQAQWFGNGVQKSFLMETWGRSNLTSIYLSKIWVVKPPTNSQYMSILLVTSYLQIFLQYVDEKYVTQLQIQRVAY